ncbi:hypothetical protein EXU57_02750 [Segetibacter sp. 3557_3]|uniref:hypothetical protein n=1 Tax=Segetibacter sp. 3557_3 TaxID=2547429 RepID=UPI0010591686|nr:hypothetical protein [Segetibacter sp. 3557_3]TDH29010.1 hypothetical protein EXU57_02750 [Segetibacter sp. 3557_3]
MLRTRFNYILRRFTLLTIAVALSTSLWSTTIVIYITPEFVMMAADSKGVFTTVSGNRESVAMVSKIYQRSNVYFSMAGVTSNNSQNFNVARLIDAELQNFTTWPEVTNRIKRSVERALLPYLNYIKSANNNLYRNNLVASDYFTSVCLIGIKNKTPYAHLLGFKVTDGATINVTTEEISYGKGNLKDAVYYLGQKTAINKYMQSVQRVTMTPEKFVEKLVSVQAASTPKLVGGPIDILRITPSGVKWIRRKKGTPVVLP